MFSSALAIASSAFSFRFCTITFLANFLNRIRAAGSGIVSFFPCEQNLDYEIMDKDNILVANSILDE